MDDSPTGRTAIVTGATGGIGLEIARGLAARARASSSGPVRAGGERRPRRRSPAGAVRPPTAACGARGPMIDVSARLFAASPARGADTPVRVASAPELVGVTGRS
ncbi:MAG: hypothetical protein ACM3JP_02725 [Betaproteobacteria bacterium]